MNQPTSASPSRIIEVLGLNPDITYKVTHVEKGSGVGIGEVGGITAPERGKVLYPPHGRSDDMVFLTEAQYKTYEYAKLQYDVGVNRDRLQAAVSGNPFQETKRQEATTAFLDKLKQAEMARQKSSLGSHYPGLRG